MRSRVFAIVLISTCILSGAAASASPVAVRYRGGLIHGFLVLSTLDGVAIAAGDLTQVARGDQVTTQIAFRFKDGSRQEETTVFSQRGNFRLISYHLVQKGPSFKNASDLSVTCATGQVTVRYTDDDGKEKVASEHYGVAARFRQWSDSHAADEFASRHVTDRSPHGGGCAEAEAGEGCGECPGDGAFFPRGIQPQGHALCREG